MPPKNKPKASQGSNSPSASNSIPNDAPMLNADTQAQFEEELCWCIENLQHTLRIGKLDERQVKDSTKILNLLMSNSTPFIKKRQLMSTNFGDYRTKMSAARDKALKGMKLKVQPTTAHSKSTYIKQVSMASGKVELEQEKKSECNKENSTFYIVPSKNDFRFNFTVDKESTD